MLWDPRWQEKWDPRWWPEKVAPQVKPLQVWQEKYLGAADDIERHGWVRGRLGEQGGPRCLIGALMAANVSNLEVLHLLRYLRGDDRGYYGYLAVWNDELGRTKAQVVFALRDCAMSGE